jgi:hypothetical protein
MQISAFEFHSFRVRHLPRQDILSPSQLGIAHESKVCVETRWDAGHLQIAPTSKTRSRTKGKKKETGRQRQRKHLSRSQLRQRNHTAAPWE